MSKPRRKIPDWAADYAGLIEMRCARETRTYVGVYRSLESGIESDPEYPYATVCEKHGSCVVHESRYLAIAAAPYPTSWCEECRDKSQA